MKAFIEEYGQVIICCVVGIGVLALFALMLSEFGIIGQDFLNSLGTPA